MVKQIHKKAKCLDCFSGSGSLGIEALSQGASYVTFVEHNKRFINNIKKTLIKLNVNINTYKLVHKNIYKFLNNPSQNQDLKYNIVFIDPPFNKGLLKPTIDLLIKFEWIKLGSLVYLEYEKRKHKLVLPTNWFVYKENIKKHTIHQLYIIQ